MISSAAYCLPNVAMRNFCWLISVLLLSFSKATELMAELASPLKAPSSVCHIPSESSAFNPPPLIKNYLSQPTQLAKKMNSVIGINNWIEGLARDQRSPTDIVLLSHLARVLILNANSRAVNISLRRNCRARNAFVKLKRVPVKRSFPEFSSFSCVISSVVLLSVLWWILSAVDDL